MEYPGANVVIDGRKAPWTALTADERVGLEIDSIVRQAHEEHEEFAYRRGMAEISKRAVLVTTTSPSCEPAKYHLNYIRPSEWRGHMHATGTWIIENDP